MIFNNKNYNAIITTRLTANFFRKLSTDAMVPFFTVYLSVHYGTLFSGGAILLILVFGIVANAYGGLLTTFLSCFKILRWGEFIHTLILFCMILCFQQGVYFLMMLYFLKGMVFSLLIPAGEAIVYSNSDATERRSIYQMAFWVNNISTPIGVTLGAVLYDYGLIYVIYFSTLMSLLSFFVYLIGFPDTDVALVTKEASSKRTWRNYFSIYYNKPAFYIIASAVLISGVEFSFVQFFPVYLHKNLISSIFLGVNFSSGEIFSLGRGINTLIIVFLSFFLMKRIDALMNERILIFSVFIFALSFVGVFLTSSEIALCVFFVFVMSVSEVVYSPLRQAIFATKIEPCLSGMYFSAYSLTARGGNIIASVILLISDYVSDTLIIIIFLLLGCFSAVLINMSQKHVVQSPH